MIDLNILSWLSSGVVIGAIVGGLIAWAREHQKVKHQFRLDIIKNRLEVITNLSNEYLLIASALEFYKSKEDDELKFYFICKFFYYYTKIAEEEGR